MSAHRHGRVELVVHLGLESHHWLLVTEPLLGAVDGEPQDEGASPPQDALMRLLRQHGIAKHYSVLSDEGCDEQDMRYAYAPSRMHTRTAAHCPLCCARVLTLALVQECDRGGACRVDTEPAGGRGLRRGARCHKCYVGLSRATRENGSRQSWVDLRIQRGLGASAQVCLRALESFLAYAAHGRAVALHVLAGQLARVPQGLPARALTRHSDQPAPVRGPQQHLRHTPLSPGAAGAFPLWLPPERPLSPRNPPPVTQTHAASLLPCCTRDRPPPRTRTRKEARRICCKVRKRVCSSFPI